MDKVEILHEANLLFDLQILETDRFEAEPTVDIMGSSLVILALFKELISEDGRDIGPLLAVAAVVKCGLYVSLLQEVLPGVLIFAFERCNHDLLLVREGEQLMLVSVEQDSSEGLQLLKTIVVNDLSADLRHDRDVGRIHKENVEHGDCEASWHFILRWLQSSFFFDLVDVLKLILFQDQSVEFVDFVELVLTVDELRVVHPAKTSHVSTI